MATTSNVVRINTQQETVKIKHPSLKGIEVVARKLDPVEAMDMYSDFAKYQKVVVLTHPTTGEILYDKDDNPLVHTVTQLPSKAVIDILLQTLVSISGIADENGKLINFDPLTTNNVKLLFKRELNVPTTVTKRIGTVDKQVKTSISFADYIQSEINKNSQEEDEVIDPKIPS